MFKLTVTQLESRKTLVLKTTNFPTREEIIQLCGVAPTDSAMLEFKTKKHFSGIFNFYEIEEFQTPTVKQLHQIWNDWIKVGVYEDQRFGQYVYNAFNYEVCNSYNIEDAQEAYNLIFNSITQSLDEVLEVD